jgi:hypothetical protein
MATRELGAEDQQVLEQVLGYLNFSTGAFDAQFMAHLNRLYEVLPSRSPQRPAWQVLCELLSSKLQSLRHESPAFQDADQAAAVLEILQHHALPSYLEFHRDLLFHQTDRKLFGPFFVGRVCEAVLRQGPPWNEAARIAKGAIAQLNDYLGHRPVAVLESQKIEPYAHEWVRPIPLYIRGVGVAVGEYREVVQTALALLQDTDDEILHSACFDPSLVDELAIDPRAYDFDHPANKRPNYHFGQWDPHAIDNQGRYRRFIVQQVTLDALMERVSEPGDLPADEVRFEAAAVLAGTILMASGVSGAGPDTHDSNVTLSTLLPRIAAYRDAFYERLLERTEGAHAARLRREAAERRQPLGGARQHLNAQLARRRAAQLEHVHLAKIFAQMGYPAAAAKQADVVPVAAARMLCQIHCHLTAGYQAITNGELAAAASQLPQIMDVLQRAIQCGAVVDPWNILGFDAHFSLFPAMENSIRDHRVDELVDLMDQIFAFYSRVGSEAAAVDNRDICRRIAAEFKDTTEWWRQFAAHEVESVDAIDPLDAYRAAQHVAEALNLWHKGGAAAGDVAFWAPYAEMFDSPKAYALVIDALLQRRDFVASMALLVHWLAQAERIPLERSDCSFHRLAQCWLLELREPNAASDAKSCDTPPWALTRKFFDYMEANAGPFWQAPKFELGAVARTDSRDEMDQLFSGVDDEDDEGEGEELYEAAYEDMVYRDSTDDGIEGQLFDTGTPTDDELEREARRIAQRLDFLSTLARLWKFLVLSPAAGPQATSADAGCPMQSQWVENMRHWVRQASANRGDMLELLDAVQNHRIPAPTGDHDSMLEYDRRRMIKDSLLERIIATTVETSEAVCLLSAAIAAYTAAASDQAGPPPGAAPDEDAAVALFATLLRRDISEARRQFPHLVVALRKQPLLYVPLSKGGSPRQIVASRVRQYAIADLLAWLPRLGLLTETCRLLETAREMERGNPVGPGAVTEFDELFKIGYKSLVESLVVSARTWRQPKPPPGEDRQPPEALVVNYLERLTESLLIGWLNHSRTLRLSVLEKVREKSAWQKLVTFIKSYGEDLFTQKFFNLANMRAILHQGADTWLRQLEEELPGHITFRLLEDLDQALPRQEAVEQLTLVLEAIIENYGEYRDYNSTTTQSDRGELLYMLLDFLRLRTTYDRIAWNLKPVVWAHEILVRRGQTQAAQLWRMSLKERISGEADKYLVRLGQLQKKYAMRMPTVADRLNERFVQPMTIDRVRALVEPAIRQANQPGSHAAFELLEQETTLLTRQPSGVGLDAPAWLLALEEEVEEVRRPPSERTDHIAVSNFISPIPLSRKEIRRQLDDWTSATSEPG